MAAAVPVPATVLPGSVGPFARPAFWRSSTGAGGVFKMKVNVRSSKMVISTGMIVPTCDSVAALYCLTKSMMPTPCGPSAVPTGGAGVALPAVIWILTIAATFFFAMTGFLAWVLGCSVSAALQLGDLAEVHLHQGLATEDV